MFCIALVAIGLIAVSACVESPSDTSRDQGGSAVGDSAPSAATAPASPLQFVGGLLGSRHDFTSGEADARVLCLTCHTPQGMTDELAVRRPEPRVRRAVVLSQDADRELDRYSLMCLSCHDGVIATDVFTSSHATGFGSLRETGEQSAILAGHPIGGLYPADHARYRAAASVTADGRIKLPENRVQCVSCHDPHNTRRHPTMLVKSNERSALCLSCHRL